MPRRMFSKFPALLLPAAMLAFMPVRGPGQLNPAVPLVPASRGVETPSDALRTLDAAQRAQELGLPSEAAGLYRKLLGMPAGSGGDRAQITLALATALLDDGDIAGAEQALQTQAAALRGSAWHLRAGLIAADQKKVEVAKAELAAVKRGELEPSDVSWWFFLQAMISNLENDGRTLDLYGQAVSNAPSAMARARFLLSQDLARLALGKVLQSDLDGARKNLENNQGKSIGYIIAREYAIMLDAFGQKSQAMEVLQRQLRGLPPSERTEAERAEADNLHLLLGLIAAPSSEVGRHELSQLLTDGSDAEKQRIALQLLARASRDGPAKADFRKQLGDLIGAPKPHPILEDLLMVRAQAALDDANYAQAEEDANALLGKFPGSQLKAQALGILTSAAWERGYYRNAADFATKARDALRLPNDRQARANLGLLIAEAYFRAEDYRNAAEAYDAVLNERPEGVAIGGLMFRRVLAEIKAADFDGPRLQTVVGPLVDRLARDPAFDAVNRWNAEWNLARALSIAGETTAAYARVSQLLSTGSPSAAGSSAGSGPALPAELRARMEWQRMRLSLEAGHPEQTLKFADDFGGVRDGVNAQLQSEISSSIALLKAQADFALGREQAAAEVLAKLRADFRDSDAAIKSYVIEADYNAKQDKTAVAQKLLNKLADEFPQSTYAPYAFFQVAQLEERRGQETNLKEANSRLEKLIQTYPESQFVFAARFEQGEILRKLNDFPPAQRAYEEIINKFPQHPGIEEVSLALAHCHAEQAAGDESHADRAKEGYNRLLALPTASPDLRVEAGFNLGNILLTHPDTRRVEDVWWRDVVHQFLLDKPEVAAQLGPNGRYWMSRTLLELGDLYKRQGHPDEAKRAWTLILETQLPAENEARNKLGAKPPEPPTP